MHAEFTVDLIEQKKSLLFVTGTALTDLAVGDIFVQLLQYGKSKHSQKVLATISLKVETIIADGEPTDAISADSAAMLALSGDAAALQSAAQDLGWRNKKQRLIRTSEAALTIARDSQEGLHTED